MKIITLLIYLYFITVFLFSINCKSQTIYNKNIENETSCDDSLWNHVYMKYHLSVIESYKKVTGTVISTKIVKDGDLHILLKLDAGQENLLNEMNQKKQNGCLVVEPICASKVYRFFVGKKCDKYINNVYLPLVGEHLEVVGSFARDDQHRWNEIHPVTKITVIR